MSVVGFPNQNLIVGWVLRTVAIPNINPHQIMKTTQALTKQAMTKREEKKVVAPISEAKKVELEKVPESEIKRPVATGWVKEEGMKSVQELDDEKRQAFQERMKYKKEEERMQAVQEKIGNKERILNLLESNALTSKEIADKLNLSEKNTRTYILRLKKEDKIKPISKKGRFSIYTLQRPPISRNQNNEIGALEDDLNYLLNLIEMKMTPKDGVKFAPTDLMNIKRIEERIADKIGGNLKAREVVKDLIDFEQSFKEEINEKITRLEKKVDFITSHKVKSKKDEILEAKNGATDLNIEDYLTKPDSVIKFLSEEQTSTSKDLLVCNVCGARFSYDYLYCSKCGNKLLKNQGSELTEIHKSVAPQETLTSPIIPVITEKRKITPEPTAEEYDYLFKSIVVGDGGVGKTALTLRFSKGFFTEDYKMTIGADFYVKTISIDTSEGAINCKLQLWDTGGQERFSSIRPMYYRGSLGAVLVFDLTNYNSFKHLPEWIEEVLASIKDEIPVLLVGNKSDLIDQRAVSKEEISKLTKDFNMYYMETSARTGDGVEDCFYVLACLIIGQGVPKHMIANGTIYAPGEIHLRRSKISDSVNRFNEPQVAYSAPLVPESTEIEFRTPNEILKEEAVQLGLETLISDGKVYKPKKIPITYFSRVPTPTPKEFQRSYSEKSTIGYNRPSPFGVLKREEPPKPQPTSMTFEPKKEKQPKKKKSKPSETSAPSISKPDTGSLFRTLTQKTEDTSTNLGVPFMPFIGESKTKEEGKSKLRIFPNVADIEADSSTFTVFTPTQPIQEEKPKSRSSDLLVCEQCGTILSSDYAFCNKCGNKL